VRGRNFLGRQSPLRYEHRFDTVVAMTTRLLIGGAAETTCDSPGCRDWFGHETLGPLPAGWTQVDPPGVGPLHYCPVHSGHGTTPA
jgi:hypothetical protein